MNRNNLTAKRAVGRLPPPAFPLPPSTFHVPPLTAASTVIPIRGTADIVRARQRCRQLSDTHRASEVYTTFVTTIISELARNILLHARTGEIQIEESTDGDHDGITITAKDQGPGIGDLQRALIGGYSTCGRMGLGISGVRRMADEFHIDSGAGKGTTVIARKWLR